MKHDGERKSVENNGDLFGGSTVDKRGRIIKSRTRMCETVSSTGISNANTLGLSGPFSVATIAARHARSLCVFQSLPLVPLIHSREIDTW